MVCNKCYAELERYSNFKENLLQKEEKFKESFFKIQEIGFKVEDTYDEEILVSMDEEQFEMVEAESEEDENHKVFIKLDGEEVKLIRFYRDLIIY